MWRGGGLREALPALRKALGREVRTKKLLSQANGENSRGKKRKTRKQEKLKKSTRSNKHNKQNPKKKKPNNKHPNKTTLELKKKKPDER